MQTFSVRVKRCEMETTDALGTRKPGEQVPVLENPRQCETQTPPGKAWCRVALCRCEVAWVPSIAKLPPDALAARWHRSFGSRGFSGKIWRIQNLRGRHKWHFSRVQLYFNRVTDTGGTQKLPPPFSRRRALSPVERPCTFRRRQNRVPDHRGRQHRGPCDCLRTGRTQRYDCLRTDDTRG